MKYKKGDKVKYKSIKCKEVCCEKCGHIENEYEDTEEIGVISDMKKDLIFVKETPELTDKVEVVDGKKVYKPYISDLKPSIEEFVYIIDGVSYTEEEIISKI